VIAGLVLAAGAAERFGAPKQLAELAGRPLLEHALRSMAAASLDRFVVVLGARAEEIRGRVDLDRWEVVVCRDWAEGQAASLRAGVSALAEADAVVVTLGDQPRVSPAAIDRVVAARGGEMLAVRASYGGTPGHPVLLERPLFGAVRVLRGDAGARGLLEDVRVRDVPCDGLGEPSDVDTPEELERLRSGVVRAAGAAGPA
jgi:CTP:molybdopterin cytidylyltransferase MocA